MVDTVRFVCRYIRTLSPPSPSPWELRSRSGTAKGYHYRLETLLHKPSGVRIQWQGKRTTVEASLPRILFGTNGRLITTEKQLKRAFKELDELLSQTGQRML